jgi:large subunit ribosomal protein L17
MLRNQASALLEHERIQTTVPKAKDLRPFVERIISIAKRSLNAPEGSAQAVTARRRVAADIADRAVVQKLFSTIAPRYVARPGGYTRLLKLGHRRGDAADLASVELVGSEFNPDAVRDSNGEAAAEKPRKKSVGGRLRDALGGGRRSGGEAGARGKVDAKGAGKKVSTPRKAGGA